MLQAIKELETTSSASYLRDDDQSTLSALKAKLPVRKPSFNIRKLSDVNLRADSHRGSRWTRLQTLGCETAVFCMLAFNGLATLAGEEFEWLLENAQRYMAIQNLPLGWISLEQIRQVMARAPRQPNTLAFLESYHKLEFQIGNTNERDAPDNEPARKRMRSDPNEESHEADLKSPRSGMGNEHRTPSPTRAKREMKYMFTNSPASIISSLPEPFKTAIENSRLWEWERKHKLNETGCLASLFPKDVTQDVSFTIWCGHDDGYHLNSVFGMRRAIAS
ncbi:conserved hypothetical protein [Histoplasma capsulatum H143]|uniref:Uncharacterized protein n=1 Tax=Ajellomyces capsulatus (strain H143) TaxID=544712 RepID=C6HFL6_AJECH|nr:conserved hypothetical protein [Histoplasma capsulatum H143]